MRQVRSYVTFNTYNYTILFLSHVKSAPNTIKTNKVTHIKTCAQALITIKTNKVTHIKTCAQALITIKTNKVTHIKTCTQAPITIKINKVTHIKTCTQVPITIKTNKVTHIKTCTLIIFMFSDSQAHKRTGKSWNLVHSELGFQQQINPYGKLMSSIKYLTFSTCKGFELGSSPLPLKSFSLFISF